MAEVFREVAAMLQQVRYEQRSGSLAAAVLLLRRVLTVDPANDEAAHYLGVHLSRASHHDSALHWTGRSLVLRPSSALYWMNQSIALQKIKNFDGALDALQRSLELDETSWQTFLNFGHVFRETKRHLEAVEAYEKSLCLNPSCAPSYEHLSFVYDHVLSIDRRIASLERARILTPDNVDVCFGLGLYFMMTGRFGEGWDLLEHRWGATHVLNNPNYSKPLSTSRPMFSGAERSGRIFLWGEQGIGDEIMFISTLSDFLDRFPLEVTVSVDDRLAPLVTRSFPNVRVIPRKSLLHENSYDFHLPLGSLPRFMRRSEQSFKNGRFPFLKSNTDLVTKIRDRLSADGRPVIGLSWHSLNGAMRCVPLTDLVNAFQSPELTLVNLQYGDHSREIGLASERLSRNVFDFDEIDCKEDIEGLAALLECCDLVVSIANTTVHLAGALGRPTIGLLPYFPGWRWLKDGSHCLWYGSVRLLRQDVLGDWSNVLHRLATVMPQPPIGFCADSIVREFNRA